MLTVEQILNAIAPQFINNSDKQTFIQLAIMRLSESCYGDNYNHAVALLSAHMLTLTERAKNGGAGSGSAGNITSLREGDAAIGYGVAGNSSGLNSDYTQTSYGMQLISLTRSNIVIASVGGEASLSCGGE